MKRYPLQSPEDLVRFERRGYFFVFQNPFRMISKGGSGDFGDLVENTHMKRYPPSTSAEMSRRGVSFHGIKLMGDNGNMACAI